MTCSSCGTENRTGRKFCLQCGSPLALVCRSCGGANEPESLFCGECGGSMTGAPSPVLATVRSGEPPASPSAPLAGPKSERRLVSVLFADLVGFTALSEQRDPEEVRDLLGRYFESAQQVVGRYGGSIEKFIGDAVMAVWGTPTAQGDDAERAVRAAIDLTQAVVALGVEVGAEDLRARAGVSTGEAAVTLGAEGQGMVAGDLVNTASRIQAAADPGTVLVGDATRRGHGSGHRLRRCRRARPERQDRAGPPVAGHARRRSQRRGAAFDRLGVSLRRARSGAADGEGALSLQRRGTPVAPPFGRGHRRHRKVPPLVGGLQVPGRAGRHGVLAPRALPCLRARGRVLGARRDGSDARRDRRGRGGRGRLGEAPRRRRAVRSRPRGTGLDRTTFGVPARPGAVGCPPTGGPVRRVATVLRATGGAGARGARVRRPPMG